MSGAPRGGVGLRLSRPGVLALIVVLGVGIGFGVRSLRARSAGRAAFPLEAGRLAIAGIERPIDIYRDARGVPHVEAAGERDAFFGWGFVHAQDRLAQMLWLRRSARGRTAEIIGAEGLEADRWARTLGLGALADAQAEHLSARDRERLDAYAAGVNARLERIRAGRVAAPLALEGGGQRSEPWRASDSLAVLKLYCWGLADTVDVVVTLREIARKLGSRASQPFFPSGSGRGAPPPMNAVTASRGFSSPDPADPLVPTSRSNRLRRAAGLDGRHVGSSAWVLGGGYTESGLPMVAADAHVEPTAPALYHVAHIRGGDFDAAGSALPGAPLFWTGHNSRIAWAATYAHASTLDLYEETIEAGDPGRYHDGGRWQPLASRVETIAIAGGGEERLEVRSTAHGPLIGGLLGVGDSLSIGWVGARADVASAFTSLGRAAGADSARELLHVLADHDEPPVAITYADGEGEAGVQVAGWLPVRKAPPGLVPHDLVPHDSRARWYDWTGRVPFAELPHKRLGSPHGWAIAADNAIGGGRSRDIGWLWRSGARADRIGARLRTEVTRGPVDLRRMAELQSDVGSERAPLLADAVLDAAAQGDGLSVEAEDVAALLQSWNGESAIESVGASAYHVLVENLAGGIFDALLGEDLASRYRALPQVDAERVVRDLVPLAQADALDGLLDPAGLREVTRRALRQTWRQLSYRLGANRAKWHWGRLHQLVFRRFGAAGGAVALDGEASRPFGGSGTTINTAEYAGATSFDVRMASTFRMVVDVGSLDHSLVAIAPGESEHPGHPHYEDGLADWLVGHSALLVTDRLLVRESGTQRLVLEPMP